MGGKGLDPFVAIDIATDKLELSPELSDFEAAFTLESARLSDIGFGWSCVSGVSLYAEVWSFWCVFEVAGFENLPPLLYKASYQLNGRNSFLWMQKLALPNVLRKKLLRVILWKERWGGFIVKIPFNIVGDANGDCDWKHHSYGSGRNTKSTPGGEHAHRGGSVLWMSELEAHTGFHQEVYLTVLFCVNICSQRFAMHLGIRDENQGGHLR